MKTQTRSETLDEMTALSEQYRKTAEAVTEQARQTMSAAQENLQHNLAEAKQIQSDAARMAVRLNEQNARLVTSAFTGFWDTSMAVLKMVTWGQEQAERAARQATEHGGLTREEGSELIRDLTDQVRHHQSELYRLAQESLRVGLFYTGKTARGEGESARKPPAGNGAAAHTP